MSPDPRTAAIEDTFRSIGQVMSWLQGCLRARFSADGISMGQMGILKVINHEGSATPKELADQLRVTTGDITGLLDKLEASGLITRRRSTQDRRVVHIEPTAKARARFKELRRASMDMLAEAFEGWTLEEIRGFGNSLQRLAAGGPASPPGPLERFDTHPLERPEGEAWPEVAGSR